ncbi:hypothetical protein BDE02_16G036100 [Populus trichocarpa]|nr:hypothetical protein BDE02_16G036100 [Populus trichocarpa]
MKRMGAWMLLAIFTLVGEWSCSCYGCLEEERIGLLEIQSLIDPHGVSWTDHWVDNNSNCCEWSRIECDNTTRRVIQLSLFGARDYSLGDWVLNASLFQPFKELQSLDLGLNGLVGCLENEGFEVLSSKLRELGLRENRFNKNDKSILSCFNICNKNMCHRLLNLQHRNKTEVHPITMKLICTEVYEGLFTWAIFHQFY